MGKLGLLLLLTACLAVGCRRGVSSSRIGSIAKQYEGVAKRIRDYLGGGAGKGAAYARLANLSDTFGPRLSTSDGFQKAAAYFQRQLVSAGVDRFWTEEVTGIPLWSRGYPNPGQAKLLEPREKLIEIMAIGNSTATPPGGITATAIVVRSFDELAALPDRVTRGSIVVYNPGWSSYRNVKAYRKGCAIEAAKKGAVAALIRSVTDQSLYTLHTGSKSRPLPGVPDIPAAAITVEDAELLQRLHSAGKKLKLSLEVNTKYSGTGSSKNIIAEITGSTLPEEFVQFGGHFDSWDVGQGAMDDGGGVAITWQALVAMKALGLRPKRTIRAVFWTAEEWGYIGAKAYYAEHKHEAAKMSLAMESDSGTFKPRGIKFNGTAAAQDVMRQVLELLRPIEATTLIVGGAGGDNTDFIRNDGVPGIELYTAYENYFWYHHTDADTMTMMNSTELDLCATVFATIAYVVADLDTKLPR